MFKFILDRFETVGQKGAEILSAHDLESWPAKRVAALKKLGLLKRASPAKTIECPGCEESCLMPVHVYPGQDDRPARSFIACDKREDTSSIQIEPAALEQWRIDISRFAALLADSLGTRYVPDEIIPQQAFYLGSISVNRKRRSAIFVASNDSLNSPLESGLFKQYINPIFLVASTQSGLQDTRSGLTILPLGQLLLLSENTSLSFEWETLETLIAEEDRRQAIDAAAACKVVTKENIFRREGQMWTVCYKGVTKHFKHSKGLLYISYLLGSPFQEFHVSELVKAFENPKREVLSFSSGEVSPKQTIANYRKRLSTIIAELKDAEDA